jgi:predicted ArsR family transcriptional regulator
MRQSAESGRREQVLSVLRGSARPMSIVEIAERLDVHPNTVRFHLETLTERGRVERVAATSAGPGRPPLRFRVRPGMDPAGPRSYEMLARILVADLARDEEAPRRAERLGRAWGRGLVQPPAASPSAGLATDTLVGLLDDLGFAPERRGPADRPEIGLRHCPFLELADQHAEVVCPIHLGLMRGAMESLTRSVTVESLEPFVEPDLCVTQLAVDERMMSS